MDIGNVQELHAAVVCIGCAGQTGLASPVHEGADTVDTTMRKILIPLGILLAALTLVAIGTFLWLSNAVPSLTEQQLRDALFTTLERESPEAFLVTGRLDMTVTTRVENSKVLLPGLIGLNLGTARATVRVPGRVSYGFEVDSLKPEMVRMQEDGSILIELPPLAVYSAAADLGRLEVETERGWARAGSLEDEVERQALRIVEGAMRRQALSHLKTSYQPRINAAKALERLLEPALRGLGMEDPRFRFQLGDDVVILPTG